MLRSILMHKIMHGFLFIVFLSLIGSCLAANVSFDSRALIIDGQRKIIISGAIHYPRSTAEMWPDLIQKAKDGGLDAIETYIFWNAHEPVRGQYDFSGNLDFIKFFKLVQQAGLYGILRIGPYVCAEWNYGGFPVWLHNTPGIQLRTDNEIFKELMKNFTTKIVEMCKEAKLFAPQGGPIILAQIENEYGNVMKAYGDAGIKYINWCAQMAVAQNIGVPWIMCQQDNAPQPMINTCNGYYCDSFKPNNPKSPKMWTENWVGWFTTWGDKTPHRTAEDCAYGVARFFQEGGILQNYYMYHGGTNFGRTSGGPWITTSYDYDAPLDEYGNLNQPKWGHLKDLHAALKSGEKLLTGGQSTTKDTGNGTKLTTFSDNKTGERFCFLSNTNPSQDANVDLGADGEFYVPAWSVTILSNCTKEIHNTAKVNWQANLVEYKSYDKRLKWTWVREDIRDTLNGEGRFKASQLLEQKQAAFDVSDYLWYMTSFEATGDSWNNATLYVDSTGQVLHAYLNKRLLGNETKNGNLQFNATVSLRPGKNILTLLSGTVGYKNYGEFFDTVPSGIDGGPVVIVGNDNKVINLTTNTWSYKVGLNGEAEKLYDSSSLKDSWETSKKLPIWKPMTWYKTTFQMPPGDEAVVLDLKTMGKGMAWVNGHSLGRFWPTKLAGADNCLKTCDYRGEYTDGKCRYNCGNPTQRWYHVPRSFMKDMGSNTLVLFEEMGGNPRRVSVDTVMVGKICGYAYEGGNLQLSCPPGKIMSEIEFASYGDPQGSCASFAKGTCEASTSKSAVEQACVGRGSCSIKVAEATFGTSTCVNKKLAVQAACT